VLLGVDGTVHGERRRARLLGGNAAVPVMVVAVGAGDRIAAALPSLAELLPDPLLTLERVRVHKRDGAPVPGGQTPCPPAPETPPQAPRRAKATGGQTPCPPPEVPEGQTPCPLQKLTVYAGEQSRHRGAPLSPQLVRALRAAGAAGATSRRGIWGYHGDHAPHGDTFRQLRRRVPIVTVLVDAPERIAALWPVIDAHTSETGLVTSELVPVGARGGR
jgi:PII-like signaling protein